MKAALYLRVSTDDQTTENQERELRAVADRLGYQVVHVFKDSGISGAKGIDKRPGFAACWKGVTRKDFDIVMAWAVDRLGRSMLDLLQFLNHLHDRNVGLYLHASGIDTTTPAGKAMFQMMGVFAEFERSMIRERVKAGMARAKANGKNVGRPAIDDAMRMKIRGAYMRGTYGGQRKTAKHFRIAHSTLQEILREAA